MRFIKYKSDYTCLKNVGLIYTLLANVKNENLTELSITVFN